MKEPIFSVVEYSSHFCVRHNPTGEEHPIGDGVDSVFDAEGNAISPGTEGFCERWAEAFNSDVGDTLAAYWPDGVHAHD